MENIWRASALVQQILSLRNALGDKEMLFRDHYPEELSNFFADTEDHFKALAKLGMKNWKEIVKTILDIGKIIK